MRRTTIPFLLAALAFLIAPATPVRGVGGATTFGIGSGDALTGETVVRPVWIDHAGGGLAGWSFGVCHLPDRVQLLAVDDGPALVTAKNGSPPDFHHLSLHADGFVTGVVICFTSCAVLAAGSGMVIHEANYLVTGLAPATAPIEFCETPGGPTTPPTPLIVVLAGGATAVPDHIDGAVEIVGPLPLRFRIEVGAAGTLYDPGDGIASATVPVRLVEEPASAGAPNPITGFTLPLAHNPLFATAVGASPGADLLLAGGGAGPDGFFVDLHPGGIVVAATISAVPPWSAALPREAALVHYDSVPTSLAFNFFGLTLPIAVSPEATSPPTPAAVLAPAPLPVGLVATPGSIHFLPREGFRRGDANDDGGSDIGDAVALLGHLFSGGTLTCREAADGNDDGALDIGDAIYLLGYFFSGGPAPPPPHPGCGFDAGAELGCAFHSSCP